MSNITLTEGQQRAVDGLVKFINSPFKANNYIGGLTGSAGTGKSVSISYIVKNCKYAKSVISFTAPTHKACRVLADSVGKGMTQTIHHTFGFRLGLNLEDFSPTDPKFQPIGKTQLDNIKVLIVDEASMLSAALVTYICEQCKKREIKVIFVGDSYQLAPINNKISVAFDRCHIKYELTEIIRQTNINPILTLATMLRDDIRNGTFEFIKFVTSNVGKMDYNSLGEGYSINNMGDFKMMVNNKFNMDSYKANIDNNRIVCYTNARVGGWNNYVRTNIINSKGKILVKDDLIMSYTSIYNDFNAIELENSEEYIIHDLVDYVDEKYLFKGYLVKFQLVHGGIITRQFFVIDHTDKPSVTLFMKTLKGLCDDALRAPKAKRFSAWKKYYSFKNRYLLLTDLMYRNQVIAKRDLDYGFAITAHKSQGSTYNTVFIDFTDMVFDKNGRMYSDPDDMKRRLYVACTREKSELLICCNL